MALQCRAAAAQPELEREWGARPAPGAPGPRSGVRGAGCAAGGGAPGLRGGHRPSCGWSASRAEAQRRSPLRSLSGPPASRRPPPLAPPSPAGALGSRSGSRLLLSLPPPALALSPLTFPSPDPRRRAPGGFAAHCRPRAARGCALYPIPAPPARSGDHTAMPGAGDRGAARAKWLGAGLLGKTTPAGSLLFLHPLSPGEGTLRREVPRTRWAP